jgi:hypothetical protein
MGQLGNQTHITRFIAHLQFHGCTAGSATAMQHFDPQPPRAG